MKAEFEEKQYEQHLNLELLEGKNLLYPPGQVLENTLGFDAALFSSHPKFWKHFPEYYHLHHRFFRHGPRGIRLPFELWSELENEIDFFPKFKCNVFIQHKRPELMKRSDALEWSSWNSPYFRYKLMQHQQEALSRLVAQTGSNSIVIYACPAFHTLTELWDAISQKNIINLSNFCQVELLDGHGSYTFQKPGRSGVAHSEPEEIESYDLFSRLNQLSEQSVSDGNRHHLSKLGRLIDSVMLENEHFNSKYKQFTQYMLQDLNDIEVASSLIKVDVFRFLTNSDVLIGY